MELKKYATLLWRWMWLILIVTALPAGITYANGRMQVPVYMASSTVLIDQAPSASYSDISSILMSQHLASTYVELMTKRPVLDKVIEAIGLNMDPASLKGAIQISPVPDTQILEVSVKHTDPKIAAEM